MKYNPNMPIWLQVMTAIQTDIVSGKLAPGDKLPGGRELALTYEINPNTAARVYQELEKDGLCETRRGLGTFVTSDPQRIHQLKADLAHQAVDHFLSQLRALGISPADAAKLILEESSDA